MSDLGLELTRRAELRIGTFLKEKWHLDALIGVGGMAAVYSATHRNGKRAAIKILHAERTIDQNIRARFLREGYVANKVGHPGTVSVLDDDSTEDGAIFLVMELLEGETLQARLEASASGLPVSDVLIVADRILDVLEAAHEKGVVHRDLKPENVFSTREGAVKLLDFGIARLREMTGKTGATGSSSSLGTPAFMPPEQARGRWNSVDAQSDLWAIGATMFTLLTKRHVHEAPTVNEHLLAAMTEPAPLLASVMPDVPPSVAAIVDKALAFDKKARFDDAATMRAAVREAYGGVCGGDIPAVVRAAGPLGPLPQGPTSVASAAFDPAAAATGNDSTTSSSAQAITAAASPRGGGRAAMLAVGIAAVALVSVAAALVLRPANDADDAPSAAGAPAPQTAEIRVVPPDARVLVDGRETPTTAGTVIVRGVPGQVFAVAVTKGAVEKFSSVVMTGAGAVEPSFIELSAPAEAAPNPSAAAATPRTPTGATSPAPTARPASPAVATPSTTPPAEATSKPTAPLASAPPKTADPLGPDKAW